MIKPPKPTITRDEFVNELYRKEKVTLDSFSKLSVDDLVDSWERIETQSRLMVWTICMYLRDKFASDQLFGKFIEDLRINHPTHPLCNCKQSTRARYIAAGRFINKYRITDLESVGLSPTVVYVLSKPGNSDVADEIYREIKYKGLGVYEVESMVIDKKRRLAQIASVESVKHLVTRTEERAELKKPVVKPSVAVTSDIIDYLNESLNDELADEKESTVIESQAISHQKDEAAIFAEIKALCFGYVHNHSVSFLTMNKILKNVIDANTRENGYGR